MWTTAHLTQPLPSPITTLIVWHARHTHHHTAPLTRPPAVRVVNNVVKRNDVRARLYTAVRDEGYPEAFMYKQKVGGPGAVVIRPLPPPGRRRQRGAAASGALPPAGPACHQGLAAGLLQLVRQPAVKRHARLHICI